MAHFHCRARARPSLARRSGSCVRVASRNSRYRAATALTFSSVAMAAANDPTATVIEYYNASLNHYFMTATPDRAAILDANVVFPGWKRTGVEFDAYAAQPTMRRAAPVCRFFGTPGVGPNSHFYTADADECAIIKQDPDWIFETIAFYIPAAVRQCRHRRCRHAQTVYRSFYPGARSRPSRITASCRT